MTPCDAGAGSGNPVHCGEFRTWAGHRAPVGDDQRMAWIMLFVAGLLEVVWAYSMKLSDGFTKPGASIVTVIAMLASFGLLAASMKVLPLGTAYTVWTGIGAAGAFVLGVVYLNEPANGMRVLAAVLIVSGIVLMKSAGTR
jgi:quaternary ammonium compound-resistance protein SugE